MLKAIVNNQSYEIETQNNAFLLDGVKVNLDVLSIENGKYFHVFHNKKSYYFEILKIDQETKVVSIGFDGRTYQVEIKDRFDLLLKSMGLDIVSKPKISQIKAPMPGLVLSIKVSENQEVKKGDAILILEAMKMENIIKSPIDGVIKNVLVIEKQAVEKNQVIINFE